MSAGVYDLAIEQGARFTRLFTWTDSEDAPIPLIDYTAAMQLRETYDGPIIATWSAHLTIDDEAGAIALNVSATVTAALPVGSGVYDIELTPPTGPAGTIRFLKGVWSVSAEVTR